MRSLRSVVGTHPPRTPFTQPPFSSHPMKTLRLLPLLLLFGLVGCRDNDAGHGVAEAPAFQADSLLDAWAQAYNAKDGAALAALFTEDGVMVVDNEVLQGREAIRQFYTPSNSDVEAAISFDNMGQEVQGTLAYLEGTYTAQVTMPDGTSQTDQGNYASVLKHGPEGWRIYRTIAYVPAAPGGDQAAPGGAAAADTAAAM